MLHPRRRTARSPRFAMRMACQVVRERDFKLVGTSVMNVSESGLFIDGRAPVREGDRLLVSFYCPAVKAWIDVEGTVARVAFGPKWMGRAQAFGVELGGADAEARENIRRTVAAAAVHQARRLKH